MSISERMTPRKMNYVLFWFLVSILVYGVWEGLSFLLGETDFRLMRVTLSFLGYWLMPVSLIWMRRSFLSSVKNLNSIVEFPTNDYSEWIRNRSESIFSINKPSSIIRLVITIVAIIVFSLLSSHILFQSFLANLISYIITGFVFILGVQGQYMVEGLLGFLNEIGKYPIHLPVFRIRHPELLKLFQFYSRFGVFVFLLIFLMLAFLLTTPFGTEFVVLLLVSLTTFYPLAMLLWSAYKIHIIMVDAKEIHVEAITMKIQSSFEHFQEEPSKENSESLDALLNVRKTLSSELDWPFDFEGVSAILVTSIIPSINLISTLWRGIFK